MKVLIVDDNANDRKLLRLNLERHACKTMIEACDGQEGFDLALAHMPDLIISDALMPRLDGFQFLRLVKEHEDLKAIPFVFHSAVYTGLKEEELAFSLGAEAFITKPKEPEEFWRELSAILEKLATGAKKPLPSAPLQDELDYHREYSRIVATKLEEKVRELEESLARHKQIEQRLQQAQEFTKQIINAIPDPVLVKDRQHRFVLVNNALCAFTGHTRDELIGKSEHDFFPKEEADEFCSKDELVFNSDMTNLNEETLTDSAGNRHFIQTRKASFVSTSGEAFLIGVIRDITERKRAEEELLKLSSAIEQSPVTIVITDTLGNIEFVNPKFTELTGYLPEEVIGQNPSVLKSGMTSPEEYKALWDTITSGNVWHGEFHNKKKNGELFREYATIAPVKNREGTITHYIAIKEDITEKRKLEDQLRHSQKMEAIGQLASGVAHDFNNLLQVITTYGFLIQKHFKKHNQPMAFVDEQMAAIRRAVELTSALLTFSRKQTLNPKPIDLNRILIESQKLLERVIGEDIVFEMTPATCEMIVRADDSAMHQVLMNLATNARDAMPKGGGLTISIEKNRPDADFILRSGCDASEEFALITVTDTGDGIATENLQHIFEPFFTTKETGKGTGLGLAIIYGIIRQHNGYVEVDSAKGKGTSFRIYLPLLIEQAATAERKTMDEAPLGSGTILLAEDDAMVRRSLHSVISGCGYLVLEAEDGEEAVKVFRENAGAVDLVIMDMIMPKMNGWDAMQEIRSIRPEVRNIFLSGYTADILESKGLDEGEGLLIMKPVNPQMLLEVIRDLLDQEIPR